MVARRTHLNAQTWFKTMSDFVTLRSHLMGSLNDLVESAGLGTVGRCSVVCELVHTGLDFGLFRDSAHPLNVSLDVGLQSGGGGAKFIRVTKLTQDAVKVSLHDGNQTVVHFTNAKDGLTEVDRSLDSLAELICSKLDERSGQSCKTYLTSLLSRAVRESHGLLVAVVKKNLPAFLKDCVELQVPIDLAAEVYSVRRDSSTVPQLHALEDLILGMRP
jgi:hypothetical protein